MRVIIIKAKAKRMIAITIASAIINYIPNAIAIATRGLPVSGVDLQARVLR